MNEFGRIADDLTALEIRVEGMLDHVHAKALRTALQRAFVEACKASRAQRLEEEGNDSSLSGPANAKKGRNIGSGPSASGQKLQMFGLRSAQVGA